MSSCTAISVNLRPMRRLASNTLHVRNNVNRGPSSTGAATAEAFRRRSSGENHALKTWKTTLVYDIYVYNRAAACASLAFCTVMGLFGLSLSAGTTQGARRNAIPPRQLRGTESSIYTTYDQGWNRQRCRHGCKHCPREVKRLERSTGVCGDTAPLGKQQPRRRTRKHALNSNIWFRSLNQVTSTHKRSS